MISVKRTKPTNPQFIKLVEALDADLTIRDGEDHDFYHQFNAIDVLKYVVVALDGETAVGCGAIKEYDSDSIEIKRMFTPENQRGKGIASRVLAELESWAAELGFSSCILETGLANPEALAMYKKYGYVQIDNYGQYAGVKTSECFRKTLGFEEF